MGKGANVKEVKVYLDNKSLEYLKFLEEKLGLSRSEIVRQAIRFLYTYYKLGE